MHNVFVRRVLLLGVHGYGVLVTSAKDRSGLDLLIESPPGYERAKLLAADRPTVPTLKGVDSTSSWTWDLTRWPTSVYRLAGVNSGAIHMDLSIADLRQAASHANSRIVGWYHHTKLWAHRQANPLQTVPSLPTPYDLKGRDDTSESA